MKKMMRWMALGLMLLWMHGAACAEVVEADVIQRWLGRFAEGLTRQTMLSASEPGADPSHPRETLLEYAFGSVLTTGTIEPASEEILRVVLRTDGVLDPRGKRVGDSWSDAPEDQSAGGRSPLRVLDISEETKGWTWAYSEDGRLCGVEFIANSGEEPFHTYTLTYAVSDGRIQEIRLNCQTTTREQIEEAFQTALEVAEVGAGELLAQSNDCAMLSAQELCADGSAALGAPVSDWIAVLGEPESIQQMPNGTGRLLVYPKATVGLFFDERTGAEFVESVSVADERVAGPRALRVGMSIQEIAALFRCDADLYSGGGPLDLYLEGEAAGEAPCGYLHIDARGEYSLHYICELRGLAAELEIGFENGYASYWRMDSGKSGAENAL